MHPPFTWLVMMPQMVGHGGPNPNRICIICMFMMVIFNQIATWWCTNAYIFFNSHLVNLHLFLHHPKYLSTAPREWLSSMMGLNITPDISERSGMSVITAIPSIKTCLLVGIHSGLWRDVMMGFPHIITSANWLPCKGHGTLVLLLSFNWNVFH